MNMQSYLEVIPKKFMREANIKFEGNMTSEIVNRIFLDYKRIPERAQRARKRQQRRAATKANGEASILQ